MDNEEKVFLDGKWVGLIWMTEDCQWACEVFKSGLSWDFIDTKEDAIEMVLDNA